MRLMQGEVVCHCENQASHECFSNVSCMTFHRVEQLSAPGWTYAVHVASISLSAKEERGGVSYHSSFTCTASICTAPGFSGTVHAPTGSELTRLRSHHHLVTSATDSAHSYCRKSCDPG